MNTKKKTAKDPEPPRTLEEQIAWLESRDGTLRRYANARIPLPKVPLEVGEAVYLGNLDDAEVVAVLDGGRRVAVRHTAIKGRADGPDANMKSIQIVPAIVVQRKSDAQDKSLPRADVERLYYSSRDIHGLVSMITTFGVDMEPEYQRELVWDLADKQRLIDSIFQQVDIGNSD